MTLHRKTAPAVPKMSFFILYKINQFNLLRKQYEKNKVSVTQCSTVRTFLPGIYNLHGCITENT